MKDQSIIRMIEETTRALADAPGHVNCTYVIPSYNALLDAAKANHADDPFLRALAPIQTDDDHTFNVTQASVLFGQLRIALQSMMGTDELADFGGRRDRGRDRERRR
jgi:hypothetical protein